MTKHDFDNYRFRKNTKVKVAGKWEKVTGVDFGSYYIQIPYYGWFTYEAIEDIKD